MAILKYSKYLNYEVLWPPLNPLSNICTLFDLVECFNIDWINIKTLLWWLLQHYFLFLFLFNSFFFFVLFWNWCLTSDFSLFCTIFLDNILSMLFLISKAYKYVPTYADLSHGNNNPYCYCYSESLCMYLKFCTMALFLNLIFLEDGYLCFSFSMVSLIIRI